jgi:hypothetical protein
VEVELRLFTGHRQAFDEADASVDPSEAPTAILEPPGDDFESQAGAAGNVKSEQCGVEVGAHGVDVVQE